MQNAINEKIRTLYILMMYLHCRVTTRAKSIAAVIARIGHVSNLTNVRRPKVVRVLKSSLFMQKTEQNGGGKYLILPLFSIIKATFICCSTY